MTKHIRLPQWLQRCFSKPLWARSRDYGLGLALGAFAVNAHASMFATQLCRAFHGVADSTLYSVLAGFGLAGLLVANSLDEGDNKIKTAAIRIGIAVTGLVNLETLSVLFTGAPWGC